MQPRNGRSRRDGGRSIVWSWWRCRSRWRDTGTWRDLLKSARRRLEARANCAILYTDNALMKHCPCPTPVDRCRPPRVSSLFLSLSLSLRFFHFSFYFLYSFSNTRERQRHKSCREILSKRWKDRSNKRSVWNNESFFEDDERGFVEWCELLELFSFFPVIDINSSLSSIICVISMYISCRVEKSNIIG